MTYANDIMLHAAFGRAGRDSGGRSVAEVRSAHAAETDAELAEAFLHGSGDSFAALVDRHMSAVYKFAYRYVGNVDATNDIVQDVFIKVWKNIRKFDRKKSFKTWLLTITKNTALDAVKKKKGVLFSAIEADGENDLDAFLAPYVDHPDHPDELLDRQYAKEDIDRALAAISPAHRSVLMLRYGEHMKFREIADTLEEPIDTIKSKHRRALFALRKALGASVPAAAEAVPEAGLDREGPRPAAI
jgi:RNA polymerase sigma-70 factor, ECF subfamily